MKQKQTCVDVAEVVVAFQQDTQEDLPCESYVFFF